MSYDSDQFYSTENDSDYDPSGDDGLISQFPMQKKVLPPTDYKSPYYIPFALSADGPKPIETLVNRFTVWKMILKHVIFYFKEISIVKQQSYLINKAMLDNLELLKKQSSGKMKFPKSGNKLKQSLSSSELIAEATNNPHNLNNNDVLNRCIQSSFLPIAEHSVLSITSTLHNWHSQLGEKELITYNQLTLKLIPRLENLKESLNETVKQIGSLKTSSDYKINDLTYEIAKTGAILADYIASIELLTKGETTTSLGTNIKFTKLAPKMDPYLLKLKLDLQLKNQLYTEAHLKESFYDIQYKAVQLENILYTETQKCVSQFVTLVNNETDSTKENLVNSFMNGFLEKTYSFDWDFFINNDDSKNLLKISAVDSLNKIKQVRKKSDVVYPYQKDKVSSFFLCGYLEKKSKYLKNYSKAYYVLTFNFLHEFKTEDRKKETTPVSSLSLNDIKVSISPDDPRKFILRIPNTNSSSSMNLAEAQQKSKYTFRCSTPEIAQKWFDHLNDLSSFSNALDRNSPQNGLIAHLNHQKSYQQSQFSASSSNLTYNTNLSTYTPQYFDQPQQSIPHATNNLVHHSFTTPTKHQASGSNSANASIHTTTPPSQIQVQAQLQAHAKHQAQQQQSSSFDKQHYQMSNHSSSSLHLPTFHSVKAMISPNGSNSSSASDLQSPPLAIEKSASQPLSPMFSSHKKTSSLSSLPSVTKLQNAFRSTNTSPINSPSAFVSPASDDGGNNNGDYFDYVAPRPTLVSRTSSSSISSNESIGRPTVVTPPYRSRSPQPVPVLSTTAAAAAAGNNGVPANSKAVTNNISTTTNNKMSTQGLARSRERFQAQLNKVPSSTSTNNKAMAPFSSTPYLLKLPDQDMGGNPLLSPRFLMNNLPQTPGFLPTNSIGDTLANAPRQQEQQSHSQSSSGDSIESLPASNGGGYFDTQPPSLSRANSSSSVISAIETLKSLNFAEDSQGQSNRPDQQIPEIQMHHYD